ncbi:MAG: hypothetical protein ABIE55_04425 [Candidatus Aenigmatarchaeota archaeon]
MEEYVYKMPKKKHTKEIIAFIIVAAVVVVILFQYEQILSMFGEPLDRDECLQGLSYWCSQCLIDNGYNFDSWDIAGEPIGNELVECSSKYFDDVFYSGQDCSGETIEKCLLYIQE